MTKSYPSKLLLFGEYTVINGGRALATPFGRYHGHWQQGNKPDRELLQLIDYLDAVAGIEDWLDRKRFRQAVQDGWHVVSNIPIGYGLGSSGALCAAVYDRFAIDKIDPADTPEHGRLKRYLAEMESYFHGTSSGVDPLICYFNYPVLITAETGMQGVSLPALDGKAPTFFLLDTQQTRKTGPLVKKYLEKCEQPKFAEAVHKTLVPQVDRIIEEWLDADWDQVTESMYRISELQLEYFREFIPDGLHELWRLGLQQKSFALKLCGAGGGGFLLGMTRQAWPLAELSSYPCEKIVMAPSKKDFGV